MPQRDATEIGPRAQHYERKSRCGASRKGMSCISIMMRRREEKVVSITCPHHCTKLLHIATTNQCSKLPCDTIIPIIYCPYYHYSGAEPRHEINMRSPLLFILYYYRTGFLLAPCRRPRLAESTACSTRDGRIHRRIAALARNCTSPASTSASIVVITAPAKTLAMDRDILIYCACVFFLGLCGS